MTTATIVPERTSTREASWRMNAERTVARPRPVLVLLCAANPLIPLSRLGRGSAAMCLNPIEIIELHRLLASRREIERLGQHQAVVRLGGGGGLRRQPERDTVEPGLRFIPHRSAQLAERHVAGRIAAHEIDQPALVRRVAFLL